MALTDKLVSIADAIRGKTGKTDALTLDQMATEIAGIQTGSNIPDGTDVTFGNVDGTPAEREEAYAIASADLNALGAVSQAVAGKNGLMTVSEMVYVLNKAKFIPQGFAASSLSLVFESSATGDNT
jgi:hypothetical protein